MRLTNKNKSLPREVMENEEMRTFLIWLIYHGLKLNSLSS